MSRKFPLFLLVVGSFVFPSTMSAKENSNTLCGIFLEHLNQRSKLTAYALEERETGKEDPNLDIPNVDIDQDKKNDELLLFRTGSASRIPADNSTLTVILSSTGEKFLYESSAFYVIRYQTNYYIVGGSWQSDKGPIHTDIHSIGRKGLKLLCTYSCGSKEASCKYR